MTAEDLKRIVLENDSERSYMTVISIDKAYDEIIETGKKIEEKKAGKHR